MADTFLTVADILALTDKNSEGLYDNCLESAQFLKVARAIPASHANRHEWLQLTARPAASFRAANAGKDLKSATYLAKTVDLKYMDASWAQDIALAKASGGVEALANMTGADYLAAAMLQYETEIFGGAGVTGGFQGLRGLRSAIGTYCVSAGGSAADVQTSAYVIYEGFDVVVKPEMQVGELFQQFLTDGDDKKYVAVGQEIGFWGSYALRADCDVVRIANIDATHPLTDDLIATALARTPVGKKAKYIVLNKEAQASLRKSRVSDYVSNVPMPTEAHGVPIVVVDSVVITNAEAVVA